MTTAKKSKRAAKPAPAATNASAAKALKLLKAVMLKPPVMIHIPVMDGFVVRTYTARIINNNESGSYSDATLCLPLPDAIKTLRRELNMHVVLLHQLTQDAGLET
jgi:hypothetical protein